MEKPDGLTVLTAADIKGRIWPLPVRKLIGVGPKTEAALARLGIATIGELAAAPFGLLVDQFGIARGTYLHGAAQGVDDSPLVTVWEPRSIGHEITFQADIAERARLIHVLGRLAREVAREAKADHLRGRTVTTRLRFADFETLTRQMTLPRATNAPRSVQRAAAWCLDRIPLVKKVRLVGVRLSRLERSPERRGRAAEGRVATAPARRELH
jgi:DNA polymerase-4